VSKIAGISMKNPAHPGGFMRPEIIAPLGLSVTTVRELAAQARNGA
jgi:antitoxin HigA-1